MTNEQFEFSRPSFQTSITSTATDDFTGGDSYQTKREATNKFNISSVLDPRERSKSIGTTMSIRVVDKENK